MDDMRRRSPVRLSMAAAGRNAQVDGRMPMGYDRLDQDHIVIQKEDSPVPANQTSRAALAVLAATLLCALLSCATPPARITVPLAVKDQPTTIASAISVSLPHETRSFVLKDKYDRVLQIGAGLEKNAEQSLRKVMRDVTLVQEGDKSARSTLVLQIDKSSKMVTGSGSKDNPKGWWASLWRPYAVKKDSEALGMAGDAALRQCLEALNA
ncbi:MAG: hypothetical protein IMZ69_07465 [Spirochaetes bacterium]|nr:hypothetical protein [Spirochaetota bacterium]